MQFNSQNTTENPLVWPLLTIIQTSQQSHKIHELATELQIKGLLPDMDNDANKALFKRNFLLMNALYQLQDILQPDHWLQVQSMNIQLLSLQPTDITLRLEQDNSLRNYYLDWCNFETSSEKVEALLTSFWNSYKHSLGKPDGMMDKTRALQIFELDGSASKQDIRQKWRKLALKWHPDRTSGNTIKFREVCEAWQLLRT